MIYQFALCSMPKQFCPHCREHVQQRTYARHRAKFYYWDAEQQTGRWREQGVLVQHGRAAVSSNFNVT